MQRVETSADRLSVSRPVNVSCAKGHLPGKKVWQNQDQRGSLKKTEWDSNRLTKYRPLQAPLSWEDANAGEKYSLFGGKKSTKMGRTTGILSLANVAIGKINQPNPMVV